MWRKTRQPHTAQCIGADPNRNFNIHWGTVGTSTNPCSDTYGGPRPFSEPEALAMSRYMSSIENLRMYLTFHSYGQYLLFPPVRLPVISELQFNFIVFIFQIYFANQGYEGPAVPNHKHLVYIFNIKN